MAMPSATSRPNWWRQRSAISHAAQHDQAAAGRARASAADQAEFLADHGEDEVGLLLRQEVQVALRALQEALAPHPARAERDLRLDDVVAGAERVALRVEEGVDARALVVVQVAVGDRARRTAPAAPPAANFHQRTPAAKNTAAADHRGDHRRAEVGLLQDQRRPGSAPRSAAGSGTADCPSAPSDARWNQAASASTRPIFISSRRLQLQPPEVDPALRALADMAHAQHQHQQRHAEPP